jgi:septum formation protein
MKLILASASPRRAELLSEAGYVFEIEPADIDESQISASSPSELAQRLAGTKADAVGSRFPDDVILAADTIVCLGEQVLGKPASADEAREMLQLLSGTTQVVITGLCVIRKSADYQQTIKVMSSVRMDTLTPDQIEKYLASGEWQGKAGGYGIQDEDPFVKRIGGSHTNVVGLPMDTARRMLARAGITPTNGPGTGQQPQTA